jgi:hypothetical protein
MTRNIERSQAFRSWAINGSLQAKFIELDNGGL